MTTDQSVCACGQQGAVTATGSASGRKHYRCPACGTVWREKNPAAVALGALGGRASAEALTPAQRTVRAKKAADAKVAKIRVRQAAGDFS